MAAISQKTNASLGGRECGCQNMHHEVPSRDSRLLAGDLNNGEARLRWDRRDVFILSIFIPEFEQSLGILLAALSFVLHLLQQECSDIGCVRLLRSLDQTFAVFISTIHHLRQWNRNTTVLIALYCPFLKG